MRRSFPSESGARRMESEWRAVCDALEKKAQALRASHQELEKAAEALRVCRRRLREQAQRDPLTGLLNRNGFAQRFRSLLTRAQRRGKPLGLLAIDIDRFKRVNDSAGHAEGDRVLKQAARCLRKAVREHGVAGRVGGDEFFVILREADTAQTRKWAERIRAAVAAEAPSRPGPTHFRITVSVGATCAEPAGAAATPDILINQADRALYRAKRAGRNRACFHAGSPPQGNGGELAT